MTRSVTGVEESVHLVFVPHTHWDREWYRTHEQFRYKLVGLLDRVLDLLETDPDFTHFTLDGSTTMSKSAQTRGFGSSFFPARLER